MIPQVNEGLVVPEEVGMAAGSAQFDPSKLELEVDDLLDSPELVEILSQHFDAHSKIMEPKTEVEDRKVQIPLTELVFENEDNFEQSGQDRHNDDKSWYQI